MKPSKDEVEFVAQELLDKVWQGAEGKLALARHVARVAVAAHWAWGDGPGATDIGLSALRAERPLGTGHVDPERGGRADQPAPVRGVRVAPRREPRIPTDSAWHVRGVQVTHWGPVGHDPWLLNSTGHYGRRTRCGLVMNVNWVTGYGGPACDHCVRGLT